MVRSTYLYIQAGVEFIWAAPPPPRTDTPFPAYFEAWETYIAWLRTFNPAGGGGTGAGEGGGVIEKMPKQDPAVISILQ